MKAKQKTNGSVPRLASGAAGSCTCCGCTNGTGCDIASPTVLTHSNGAVVAVNEIVSMSATGGGSATANLTLPGWEEGVSVSVTASASITATNIYNVTQGSDWTVSASGNSNTCTPSPLDMNATFTDFTVTFIAPSSGPPGWVQVGSTTSYKSGGADTSRSGNTLIGGASILAEETRVFGYTGEDPGTGDPTYYEVEIICSTEVTWSGSISDQLEEVCAGDTITITGGSSSASVSIGVVPGEEDSFPSGLTSSGSGTFRRRSDYPVDGICETCPNHIAVSGTVRVSQGPDVTHTFSGRVSKLCAEACGLNNCIWTGTVTVTPSSGSPFSSQAYLSGGEHGGQGATWGLSFPSGSTPTITFCADLCPTNDPQVDQSQHSSAQVAYVTAFSVAETTYLSGDTQCPINCDIVPDELVATIFCGPDERPENTFVELNRNGTNPCLWEADNGDYSATLEYDGDFWTYTLTRNSDSVVVFTSAPVTGWPLGSWGFDSSIWEEDDCSPEGLRVVIAEPTSGGAGDFFSMGTDGEEGFGVLGDAMLELIFAEV